MSAHTAATNADRTFRRFLRSEALTCSHAILLFWLNAPLTIKPINLQTVTPGVTLCP
jgi:hypothetical protein